MSDVEFGIRDLRNSTTQVLDAVRQGRDVYLTRHGVRVARVIPVDSFHWGESALDYLDGVPAVNTGWAEELQADKDLAIAIEESARGAAP